jgi:hypothetical protein
VTSPIRRHQQLDGGEGSLNGIKHRLDRFINMQDQQQGKI